MGLRRHRHGLEFHLKRRSGERIGDRRPGGGTGSAPAPDAAPPPPRVVPAIPPQDINHDGVVNVNEIATIGQHWLTGNEPPGSVDWDVNGDGVTNVNDVVIVGWFWLQRYQLPYPTYVQVFGASLPASFYYSGVTNQATPPSASITSGWAASPNGMSTRYWPPFIEAGAMEDCAIDCTTAHPYVTYQDAVGDPIGFQRDPTANLAVQQFYTFQAQYDGVINNGKTRDAYWCIDPPDQCRQWQGWQVDMETGASYFVYVIAGGETDNPSTSLGTVYVQNATLLQVGSSGYTPWCWYTQIIRNADSSHSSLSACNSTNHSWTAYYRAP
jgi:hypothetical protein